MADPRDNMIGSWQESLARQLDGLGRWIQERLIVAAAPDDERIPAESYLDPDRLRKEVARAHTVSIHAHPAPGDGSPGRPVSGGQGAAGGYDANGPAGFGADIDHSDGGGDGADEPDLDLRLAVSRFTRHYTASVSCIALVGLARGIGINVAADRCTMIIRHDLPMRMTLRVAPDEVVRCAERPTRWTVGGPTVETVDELRRYVWRKLYSENIAPVFGRILALYGVSPKLIWANAAEWVGFVSDAAEEYLGSPAAEGFVADRRALLAAESLPGLSGANPLRGQLHWDPVDGPGYPQSVQTRRTCCITYLLKDRRGRLCQNCPYLPLKDRVELIRERHGVPMGQPGGVAERRSIEVGLARLPPGR